MSDYQNLMYGINSIMGQKITNTLCSMGSMIFLEWGKDIDYTLPSGKIVKRKEWIIGLNLADWRITRNGQYFLGCEDPYEMIASNIKILQGKILKSFQTVSHETIPLLKF